MQRAAGALDPENRRAVGIQAGERDRLIESGADKHELLVGRDHDHGGDTVPLAVRIHRVSLGPRLEHAFGIDRHQPKMIRSERVQHEEGARRRSESQRFGRATPALDRVAGRLHVEQRETTVALQAEARNGIVSAIGRKQKAPIGCNDDASCTLVRVGRAVLAADRLEFTGAGAARLDTRDLGQLAVRLPRVVNNGVIDLIGLDIEMASLPLRHSHLARRRFFSHLSLL
ncbi:hypothetical protein ACVWXQ_005413 [Bradyrhizobium sp. S3.14.4]